MENVAVAGKQISSAITYSNTYSCGLRVSFTEQADNLLSRNYVS